MQRGVVPAPCKQREPERRSGDPVQPWISTFLKRNDVKKRNQSNIIEQQGGQEHPEAGGQEAVLEVVPWG